MSTAETHLSDLLAARSRRGGVEALADWKPSQKYLVAVSGGRDSVFLLRLLVESGYRKLTVCHLDHGLRGKASREDAAFVKKLARKLGVEYRTGRTDVAALANTQGLSIEAAGREARLAFFARCAAEAKCSRVFLGQHADDRVETFLWNLFRGSGMQGLSALPAAREIRTGGRRLTLIRPLVGVHREEINRLVEACGIDFREDASNSDPRFTRNRIRFQILPLLERETGRNVREVIWRAAEILTAESEALDALLPPLGAELSVAELKKLPVALQRRTIRAWLAAHRVSEAGHEEIEAIRGLVENVKPARVNLAGNRWARRRTGRIFVESIPLKWEKPEKAVASPRVKRL